MSHLLAKLISSLTEGTGGRWRSCSFFAAQEKAMHSPGLPDLPNTSTEWIITTVPPMPTASPGSDAPNSGAAAGS
eukprot:6831094-Pyramimonas_sp.AAC.1